MRDEHEIVKHRFLALIQQKLANLDKRVVKLLSQYEKRIYKITEISDYSEDNLRKITRQIPEINYLLVLDKKGNRIFPLKLAGNQDEREFVQRSTQFAQRYYARNSVYRSSKRKELRKKSATGFYDNRLAIAAKKTTKIQTAKEKAPVQAESDIPSNQLSNTRRLAKQWKTENKGMMMQTHPSAVAIQTDKAKQAESSNAKAIPHDSRPVRLGKNKDNEVVHNKASRQNIGVRNRSTTARSKPATLLDSVNRKPDYPLKGKQQAIVQQTVIKGWSVWFWKNGINLIYTVRNRDGYLFASEVSRAKLLSDIIAVLPAQRANQTPQVTPSRITLTDAKGAVVYQWGTYKTKTKIKETPQVSYNLSSPLNSLKFNYYSSAIAMTSASSYLPLFFSVTGVFMAILGLAYYFYRENNRELETAQRKVTFVNQVSHELKTPLTNIRMYAELLEDSMDEADPQDQRRMKVIVNESQRLSRLINNVLNFARHQRNKLVLIKSQNTIDEIISSVLAQFGPSLKSKSIQVEFEKHASDTLMVDTDIIEQILNNLISNVEKYASHGKYLGIRSSLDKTRATIIIEDHGPGIPKSTTRKIFEPFYRASNKLTEGISGTGIGLTISRELARLHGGDLVLTSTKNGAKFTLTLDCENKIQIADK